MNNLKLTIIGITDLSPESFAAPVQKAIACCTRFAGGLRHHELVSHLLPANHQWTDIEVPLKPFLEAVAQHGGNWAIFASGDPLFFGIGITLKREFPNAEIEVFPSFNSLQMLAHKLLIPYGEYEIVTLTGRDWNSFDSALIRQIKGMGVLTDRHKTPSAIARRMLDYGYNGYKMHVGERLGGVNERIRSFTIEEAANSEFDMPNALYIIKESSRNLMKSIPDYMFTGLAGRPKMITKMPIRVVSVMVMQLHQRSVLWDIGACTGSISVESKLQAPHLNIYSFEIREESRGIIPANCKRFGTPGIEIIIDDFSKVDKSNIKQPDAIFLGGYGGKMEMILDEASQHLKPGGCIVFNAVSFESKMRFVNWTETNKYQVTAIHTITCDGHNPIDVIAISKPYPSAETNITKNTLA